MKVKCLAQEHNAVPRPGLEPGPPNPESSALTIRPPRLPQATIIINNKDHKNRKMKTSFLVCKFKISLGLTCYMQLDMIFFFSF